ncbi:MAG: hypothetical protein PHO30_00560 [Candidatus Omnitrophica bacterium]|nr:hypothetical protein [Candidatus Omnitrophota bacterium]
MRKAGQIALVVAGVSLLVGIISRALVMPVPPGTYGLEANAFLRFTDTCLLAAIVFFLAEKK